MSAVSKWDLVKVKSTYGKGTYGKDFMLNINLNMKVFTSSLFTNPALDLVYTWYKDIYWSKILYSTISSPIPYMISGRDVLHLC